MPTFGHMLRTAPCFRRARTALPRLRSCCHARASVPFRSPFSAFFSLTGARATHLKRQRVLEQHNLRAPRLQLPSNATHTRARRAAALPIASRSQVRGALTFFFTGARATHVIGYWCSSDTVVALRGCDRASPPRARSALADPAALFDSRSTQQNTTSHMQNSHRHTVNEQIALLETDEQITLLESKVRSLLTRVRTPQSAPLRTPVRSPLTARVRACDAESSFARAEPAVQAANKLMHREGHVYFI